MQTPMPQSGNRAMMREILLEMLRQESRGSQGPSTNSSSGVNIDQILKLVDKLGGSSSQGSSGGSFLDGLFGGGSGGGGASSLTQPMTIPAGAEIPPGFTGVGTSSTGGTIIAPGGTAATTSGPFSLSGIGSAGNAYLPALGAIGTYDLLKNNRQGKRGYLQGAASGAAMGSYFGPWGALIGGGVGLGMAGANELFDTNRYKKEGNRLSKLIESGVNVPEGYRGAMGLTRGRSKSELVNPKYAGDFVGQTADGFVNNKFANSRNEGDLRPEDIWGYASFFEKYGNDWMGKFNEQQRRDIAQKALDAGAVREHHGTIDIDWNKVNPPQQAAPLVKPAVTQPQNKNMIPRVNK